jgi:hypothetical protein
VGKIGTGKGFRRIRAFGWFKKKRRDQRPAQSIFRFILRKAKTTEFDSVDEADINCSLA